MKRHEWWRAQYQADPYMRGLPDDYLKVRTDDVTANGWFITDDLKLGMQSPAINDFWMVSWTHLLEEWGLRGGIPGGPDVSKMPDLDWPGLPFGVTAFKNSRDHYKNVLVKYGQSDDLLQSIAHGHFQISPASRYNDPSLNIAIRDNELELSVYRHSPAYKALYDKHGRTLSPLGPRKGRYKEVLTAPTNYYVFCLCMERSIRMFGDFKANAALIVHKPDPFVRRLGEGVRTVLGRNWNWYASPIRYVDPLRAPIGPLDIVRCKHFLFTYQCEYRIVWIPNMPVRNLDSFTTTVEPVADIANLITLI